MNINFTPNITQTVDVDMPHQTYSDAQTEASMTSSQMMDLINQSIGTID